MIPVFYSLLAALIAGSVSVAHAQHMIPQGNIPGTVQLVQVDEPFRINQLEEQVRQLNGKVEELNFLLLQLQEKIRQMEEDSELRFQELEDKQSQLGDTPRNEVADNLAQEHDRLGKSEPSEEITTSDDKIDAIPLDPPAPAKLAKEPRALGTLTFDADGNVVDSSLPKSQRLSGLPGIFNDGFEGAVEAAQFGTTPEEVLAEGIGELRVRQFKRAEQILQSYLKAWPNDPDVGTAKFYLGESYFWQKEYYRAANSHLDAHNNYPEAETAPDNLLALGLALAGLNQREVACATYAEVLRQYPEAEPRLGVRVRDEQAATKC